MSKPDDIYLRDIPQLIRSVKAFVGIARLAATATRLEAIDSQNNPFRSLLVREKQPLLNAFAEYDAKTLKGMQRLRAKHITDPIRALTYLGALLRRVEPTLPAKLKDHQAAKLMDMHGKSLPVVMEWESAAFYLRHGYSLKWTDAGVAGPEFTVEKSGIVAEFECKRFKRSGMEKLGDREATSIANGLFRAMDEKGLAGTINLTVTSVTPPDEEQIKRIGLTVMGDGTVDIDCELPNVGHLKIGFDTRPRSIADVETAIELASHDCRKFAAGSRAVDGLSNAKVLFLKGRRRSTSEFLQHIETELDNAAGTQLTGNAAGFLVVEIEDVDDVSLYGDKPIFDQIADRLFRKHVHLGGVVWRGSRVFDTRDNSIDSRIDALVMRNANCSFQNSLDVELVE